MSVAIWLIEPPLLHYALIHLTSLWLIRSLYFHASILSTLLDFGVIALGLAVALWALIHSGSLLLSLWCFFLVQAVFVAIPGRIRPAPTNQDCKQQQCEVSASHAKRPVCFEQFDSALSID